MAEQSNSAAGQPAGAVAGPVREYREPEIHVMPERYRGAAARAKLPPAASAKPVPAAGAAAAPAKPTGPGRGLLIAGLVLFLVIGATAAVFLWPRAKPTLPPPPPAPLENVNLTPPPAEAATTTPEIATTTPEVAPSPPPVALAPVPGKDTDADGLTDREEKEIYATDPLRSDTDADGYLDGGEVFYLYNPAGVAPVTLKETGTVRTYLDKENGFSLLLPPSWTAKSIPSGTVFIGASGEFVQVLAEANPKALTVKDWFGQRHPGEEAVDFTARTGLAGLKSSDGLTAYLATSTKVMVISYGTAGSSEISYRRTMEMMINSFKFIPTKTPVPALPAPEAKTTSTATATPAITTLAPAITTSTATGTP